MRLFGFLSICCAISVVSCGKSSKKDDKESTPALIYHAVNEDMPGTCTEAEAKYKGEITDSDEGPCPQTLKVGEHEVSRRITCPLVINDHHVKFVLYDKIITDGKVIDMSIFDEKGYCDEIRKVIEEK